MTLNFPRREPLSINELSEKTDLSWATTQKYVQLLEALGRIAPKISINKDGVTPIECGENFYDIDDQEDIQLVIYLFTHANIEGGPTTALDIDTHSDVLIQYEKTIEELEKLGWLELTEDTIRLTSEGVSIAGPAHSRIRNQDIEVRPNHTRVQATSRPESSGDANILIDDPAGDEPISTTKSKTERPNTETNWADDYSKNDFAKRTRVSSQQL
jgi:predicted transcriptional regulator